ncbi:2,3-diketo-L-gulonate reductase [Salmonella enterica subsp. enterica]|nr:2,3-diketo-L-gulonate reductase [Salmonella enterica subsp. enterica] [Salmonella enterica subsp. enterica serovar Menston]
MKVAFEELKGAFYRVLRSRNIAEDTADACAEMFARTTESGCLFPRREPLSPLHPATG